ncbi:hypothetical protein AAFF_G00019400 [Aldrovandia affinis]|uniref:Uncharacterized protein n=1 Tax=Aldrovandia affinis TaxID=143900 RepID=A0AAD7S5T3_9TELE|nr:hypothetical protein AAFF_G00019400 [Aldrovandia affinis]
MSVAHTLQAINKTPARVGRPLSSPPPEHATKKSKRDATPTADVCYDNVGHWPVCRGTSPSLCQKELSDHPVGKWQPPQESGPHAVSLITVCESHESTAELEPGQGQGHPHKWRVNGHWN